MPKLETTPNWFAVIYTPQYRLQCAQQRQHLAGTRNTRQLELSIEGRSESSALANRPAALLGLAGDELSEVNEPAELLGVTPGITSSLALARAPELQLFAPDPETEQRQQAALLQLCYRYSPFLEDTAPGICTLDLRGRKDRQSEWWARELLAHWQLLGFRAQVGSAPNPEIAAQAARIANPLLMIPAQSSVLQSLSIELLKPSAYLREILSSWGIRTLGALMQLPREEVAQRLGLEGLALWDRAAGRSQNLLRQVQLPESFLEFIELETSLETLEPLLFLLRRFLERLSLRIAAVYRLIAEIRLTLTLDNGEKLERPLQIPAPTLNVESLFRVALQYLENVQTDSPIVAFAVEARASNPGQNQFDLFRGGLKDPNRFFQTLARLAALVGNERVGIPEKLDTHRPDSFRLRTPTFDWSQRSDKNVPKRPRIGLPLRHYRPAISVEVRVNDQRPLLVQSRMVSGKIQRWHGPWQLSGQWWDPQQWETEEWDVQLENGGIYRLARNSEKWWLLGVYD